MSPADLYVYKAFAKCVIANPTVKVEAVLTYLEENCPAGFVSRSRVQEWYDQWVVIRNGLAI